MAADVGRARCVSQRLLEEPEQPGRLPHVQPASGLGEDTAHVGQPVEQHPVERRPGRVPGVGREPAGGEEVEGVLGRSGRQALPERLRAPGRRRSRRSPPARAAPATGARSPVPGGAPRPCRRRSRGTPCRWRRRRGGPPAGRRTPSGGGRGATPRPCSRPSGPTRWRGGTGGPGGRRGEPYRAPRTAGRGTTPGPEGRRPPRCPRSATPAVPTRWVSSRASSPGPPGGRRGGRRRPTPGCRHPVGARRLADNASNAAWHAE